VSATVPKIPVICAGCGKQTGTTYGCVGLPGRVSHTICPDCLERLYGNRGVARGLHGVRP